MIRIPGSVRVGGMDYAVKYGEGIDDELNRYSLDGRCEYAGCRILLRSTVIPQVMGNVFIHELLHAVDNVYNNFGLSEEETWRLAHGITQVLKDMGIEFELGD